MEVITIEIPDSLVPVKGDLVFFIQMMARKLHTNRHKGFAGGGTLEGLRSGLCSEVAEMEHAIKFEGQFEAAAECADVANFAFLMFNRLLFIDKPTYKDERENVNT